MFTTSFLSVFFVVRRLFVMSTMRTVFKTYISSFFCCARVNPVCSLVNISRVVLALSVIAMVMLHCML